MILTTSHEVKANQQSCSLSHWTSSICFFSTYWALSTILDDGCTMVNAVEKRRACKTCNLMNSYERTELNTWPVLFPLCWLTVVLQRPLLKVLATSGLPVGDGLTPSPVPWAEGVWQKKRIRTWRPGPRQRCRYMPAADGRAPSRVSLKVLFIGGNFVIKLADCPSYGWVNSP